MGIGEKIFLMACILFAIFFTVNTHTEQERNNPIKPEIAFKMKKLRMPFLANDGQADEMVKFYTNTFAVSVSVTKDGEIVYCCHRYLWYAAYYPYNLMGSGRKPDPIVLL